MSLLNKIFIAAMIVCFLPLQGNALFGINARKEQKKMLAEARAAYESGDYQTAINVSEQLILTNAPKRRIKRAYLVLGPSYKALGDYAKALLVYTEALEFYPKDVDVALGLADIYFVGGLTDKAIEIYNGVLVVDSDNMDARLGLARAYYVEGFYTRASKYFKEYIDNAEEEDITIYKEYMLSQYAANRFQSALELSQKIEAMQSEADPELKLLVARIYKAMGNKEIAFKTIEEAYNLAPQNKEIAFSYAIWLTDDDQNKKAAQIVNSIKDKSGSQRLSLFIKFMINYKSNNRAAAVKYLKEIVDMEGDGFIDKVARKMLEVHFTK